jgi:hypothetical protein
MEVNKKISEKIKKNQKFIELSLYSFSFLSLFIGIGLMFFGKTNMLN